MSVCRSQKKGVQEEVEPRRGCGNACTREGRKQSKQPHLRRTLGSPTIPALSMVSGLTEIGPADYSKLLLDREILRKTGRIA